VSRAREIGGKRGASRPRQSSAEPVGKIRIRCGPGSQCEKRGTGHSRLVRKRQHKGEDKGRGPYKGSWGTAWRSADGWEGTWT
jgi:hypothetical protein